MIRKLCVIALLLLAVAPGLVAAQGRPNPFVATVTVESAFVRIAPALDAEPVASVFQDDRLLAVSRNLDGTWFEVRRPGRLTNLGWIYEEVLDWEFEPEALPLGDSVTGVIGPVPLVGRPPYAVFLREAPILRETPSRSSTRIRSIPPLVTIPVLERNQDGSWLRVNYLGYEGWISGFTARRPPFLLDIPVARGLPPLEVSPVLIIPVEIQQAQIDRLREFITTRRVFAAGLESFWWAVFRGEIMPCDAPPELTYYPYGEADVRELPELQRYAPRLVTAIDYLNSAREPFLVCGVVRPEIVRDARDHAINARIIFDATLEMLETLEEDVVQARR